jgi:uncharacterized protein
METRTFEVEGLELREADGQAQPTITGYAIVFNSWSVVMSSERGRQFRERFAPGAFDRWLGSAPDIRALWNHNSDFPLGRTRNGTLRVQKDGAGIRFELDPPATSWGADAVASIRRGDVSGVSFEFGTKRDGSSDVWEKPGPDGVAFRTVLDADLYEISPVVFPAYPASNLAVRSVEVPEFPTESDGRAAGEIDEAQAAGRAAWRARMVQLLELGD